MHSAEEDLAAALDLLADVYDYAAIGLQEGLAVVTKGDAPAEERWRAQGRKDEARLTLALIRDAPLFQRIREQATMGDLPMVRPRLPLYYRAEALLTAVNRELAGRCKEEMHGLAQLLLFMGREFRIGGAQRARQQMRERAARNAQTSMGQPNGVGE